MTNRYNSLHGMLLQPGWIVNRPVSPSEPAGQASARNRITYGVVQALLAVFDTANAGGTAREAADAATARFHEAVAQHAHDNPPPEAP